MAMSRRLDLWSSASTEGETIHPLPKPIHAALIVISTFALLSFVTTTSLFTYLNYKLVTWRLRWKSRVRNVAQNIPEPPPIPEFTFEDGHWVSPGQQQTKDIHERNLRQIRESTPDSTPNQFLILIYNLLLADMHQATSFSISAIWVGRDGIFKDSAACWVQGFFDSNGDLAASLFITFIAVHSYLSVVRGYQLPQGVLYILVAVIWLFVYGVSVIPILITRNGKSVDGYFVRAGAWCWINERYDELRLLTHYLFIFISIVTTSALYIAITLSLRKQAKRAAEDPARHHEMVHNSRHNSMGLAYRHPKAFLIYPLIYGVTILPLAVGRIASMAKAHVPITYYCFAGAMVAISGFMDCVLFGFTRQSIVFASKQRVSDKDTGLGTFKFMRTPASHFGNEVWISGGKSSPEHWEGVGGWFSFFVRRSRRSTGCGSGPDQIRINSQESLRRLPSNEMTIHMDVVTTVEVEVDRGRGHNSMVSGPPLGGSLSMDSDDRQCPSLKEIEV